MSWSKKCSELARERDLWAHASTGCLRAMVRAGDAGDVAASAVRNYDHVDALLDLEMDEPLITEDAAIENANAELRETP